MDNCRSHACDRSRCRATSPLPQPQAFHNFADQRAYFGIPYFWNVVSNLPFLFFGAWGLVLLLDKGHSRAFRDGAERVPYLVLFAGVALTCFGSAYYHLHPDNARLVWDRLPMTLGFMGVLSAALAERVGVRTGLRLLPVLMALGVASVFYWNATELRGAGDVRPYLVVQFGSVIAIALLLALFPARYTHGGYLALALITYMLAKAFEVLDAGIFELGRVVSGHTLKHITAALAIGWIVGMLRNRTTLAPG